MPAVSSLIDELEAALQSGSKDKRIDSLRRITDLFVAGADRFSDQQIEVFDDVLEHLVKRIESKAREELSHRLGPIDNAPPQTVRRLARDDDIKIAAPILTRSRRLTNRDLIDIAGSKSQDHLLAIAGRTQIATNVTDALLRHGDKQVLYRLADNTSAKFSEGGYSQLVEHSAHDESLAEKCGHRRDIPLKLFRELLLRATETVRDRLLATADRSKIEQVLMTVAENAEHEAGYYNEHHTAEAHGRMLNLKNRGLLVHNVLAELAKANKHADVLVALALLCGTPMPLLQILLQSEHLEARLIPFKAAGTDWRIVEYILSRPSICSAMSAPELETAELRYSRLSQAGAGRILRFWQVRQTAAKDTNTLSQPSMMCLEH